MEKYIKQLSKCLNIQIDLYNEMIELSEKKRKIIINNEIDALNFIVEKEKFLIEEITKIDELRQKYAAMICNSFGITDDITLTKIIEIVDNEDRVILTELLEKFSEIVNNQKRINNINNELINTQLNYMERLKSAFFADEQNNYTMDGQGVNQNQQSINLFDRMV